MDRQTDTGWRSEQGCEPSPHSWGGCLVAPRGTSLPRAKGMLSRERSWVQSLGLGFVLLLIRSNRGSSTALEMLVMVFKPK